MPNKLGLHISGAAPRDGYGHAAKHLPVVVSFEAGAFDELDPRAIKIFRTHTLDNHKDVAGDFDKIPDKDLEMVGLYWWNRLEPIFRAVRDRYKNVYFQPINEINNPRTIPYLRGMVKGANRDGYKLALWGDAGDSPSDEDFVNHWIPFMKEVQADGHIYCCHAYTGVNPDSSGNGTTYLTNADGRPTDANSARPFVKLAQMKTNGVYMPMVIGELGWFGGTKNLPAGWLEDALRYNELMIQEPQIIGACLWNSGRWQNYPNQFTGDNLIELAGAVRASETAWFDVSAPLPPVEPEPPIESEFDSSFAYNQGDFDYHSVGYLLPQDAPLFDLTSLIEWDEIAQGYHDARRTITYSHHDWFSAMSLASSQMGYIYGDRPEAIELADKYGLVYEVLPIPEKPIEDELEPFGWLKLGQPLDAPWVITDVFNSPRNYKPNFKHEGIDIDVIGTNPDSKSNALAMIGGEVVKAIETTSGYGKRVVVRTVQNGEEALITYAHLDDIFVTVGELVTVGQPLGEIGNTGNSTGEHLHITIQLIGFGLRGYVRDWVVDPRPWLPKSRMEPDTPTKIDLRPYMGVNGSQYMTQIISGSNVGKQEKYHIHLNSDRLMIQKNGLVEYYPFDRLNLHSGLDNSLDENHMYTVTYNGGFSAIRWPLDMAIGEEFWGNPHVVKVYNKRTGEQVHNHPAAGIAQNYAKLIYQGKLVSPFTGRVYDDVIHMLTGTGENQYWQRGVGPVLWISDWGVMEYAADQGNVATQNPHLLDFPEILRMWGVS